MSIITKILGDPNEKVLKQMQPIVEEVNKLEGKFKKFSDGGLKKEMGKLKKLMQGSNEGGDTNSEESQIQKWEVQKETLDKILPEVFAMVREAARRTLGERHYDVQLMGGIVLHRGQIGEMRTGEGKTLVASLPVSLNALAGRGVHVVTPNDYLSRVGGGWMGPIYKLLGLSVGVITHDFAGIYDPEYISDESHGEDKRLRHWKPVSRKDAYACDITYGTNNEFGFDYLRDNMVGSLEQMVQRPARLARTSEAGGDLHYAIVDEIDSILIDEARTPLIISAPAEESTDKYRQFAQLVTRLKENEDYNIDEKMRAATLTEAGLTKMEKLLGVDNIYTSGGLREVHHIEQALKANTLFKRDRDYVVSAQGGSASGGKEGEVIIVDEFTGRLMPGRRFSEGLHQAIEAKEAVSVQRESMTMATVTFQNYFRMYTKLAGMTGTAVTEAEEFHKIYGLETVVVPTHKPMVRKDMTDLVYATEQGKYKALAEEIKERHKTGQPILVGTISIEKNEMLGELLERAGVKAQILNAKHHEKEAKIISQAGRLGAVTIATNMAGRGVDIILGGSDADKIEAKKVRELGGLHVIGTERHEARRIDNQLRGRSGRQGDAGSSQFYLSMEDDLMRIFGGERMKNIMSTLKVPEDLPIENRIIAKSIESAQKKVEANNFDIRKHLVEYDDVINKHREAIYKRRRNVLTPNSEVRSQKSDIGDSRRGGIAGEGELEKGPQEEIRDMLVEEITMVVNFHTAGDDKKAWNLKEIQETIKTIFVLPDDFQKKVEAMRASSKNAVEARQKIIDYIVEQAQMAYGNLEKEVNELLSQTEQAPENPMRDMEKQILIRAIDMIWTEHIDVMDQMRRGIGLRGYGQRDPLIEYKKEAYNLFQQLNDLIRKQVVYSIFKVADVTKFAAPSLLQRARQFSGPDKTVGGFGGFQKSNESGSTSTSGLAPAQEKAKTVEGKKVGRNEPCPCGATKPNGKPIKYKHCHGK